MSVTHIMLASFDLIHDSIDVHICLVQGLVNVRPLIFDLEPTLRCPS